MDLRDLDVGRAVRGLREERGWSQFELGRRANMHHATISKIELGKRSITFLTFIRLADALEVPWGDLARRVEAEERHRLGHQGG